MSKYIRLPEIGDLAMYYNDKLRKTTQGTIAEIFSNGRIKFVPTDPSLPYKSLPRVYQEGGNGQYGLTFLE